MKGNVIYLQNVSGEMLEELEFLIAQAREGIMHGLVYCYVERDGSVVIGAAGKLLQEKMCDGLGELLHHILTI